MSPPPIDRSRYFFTLIGKVSGHVSAFHLKTEGEGAYCRGDMCTVLSLEWTVKWRRSFLMRAKGKNYVKRAKKLKTDGIDIYVTTS